MHQHSISQEDQELDVNVVAMWLKKDPTRWTAGVMAGLFAGVIMLAFAAILCVLGGKDPMFPVKLGALPILGNAATAIDAGMGAIVAGLIMIEALCALLGFAYAHFTFSNASGALLGMGFVWGAFAWIFIQNLYIQSFKTVFAVHISSGAAFITWQVFGLALTSVCFFDRMLRSK